MSAAGAVTVGTEDAALESSLLASDGETDGLNSFRRQAGGPHGDYSNAGANSANGGGPVGNNGGWGAGDDDGASSAEGDNEVYTDAEGHVQRLQSPMTIDWQHMRTSLANERTFLAWIRTAMSVFSFGWAVLKVQECVCNAEYFTATQLHWYDELVGYAFCIGGCLVLFIGTQRYLRVRSALAFPESVVRFGRIGIRYCVAVVAVCLVAALLRLTVNDIQSHFVTTAPAQEL